MRAYHHFPIIRSSRHVLASFGLLALPLLGLLIFSQYVGIPIHLAFLDLGISVWRLAVALIIATVVAWLLVIWLVRGKTEAYALPVFDLLQSLPTFTILPIAVHFLGASNSTIIFFLTITIIWPILFSIVSSIKQIQRSWTEAVQVSGIRGYDYVKYFLLPITAPGIITGVIIGLGDGWEALIATEIILRTHIGLGPFFQTFAGSTSSTIFGVVIFLFFIFSINKLVWLPLLERSHASIEQ